MSDENKTHLLVVDDDGAVRKLLERIALRAGFSVDTARDGQHAMEKLEQKRYDIVIVDLMMPRVSGYELVQKISSLDPRPCVIVSTAMTNGEVAKLDDSMVRRVIKKPFDIEAVAKTLIETARELADDRSADAATIPLVNQEGAIVASDAKVPIAEETAPPPSEAESAVAPSDDATPVPTIAPEKPPR